MMWRTLNEIIKKPKKQNKIQKTFFETDSSKEINDPQEIVNKVNEYFINVGPKLADKIKANENIFKR